MFFYIPRKGLSLELLIFLPEQRNQVFATVYLNVVNSNYDHALMRRLLPFLLLLMVFSCEENNPRPNVFQIDEALMPYLETFLAEADRRGLTFGNENLVMEFGTAPKEACGQCTIVENGGQRTIVIVQNSFCWLDVPIENREAIIFHELGHCLLVRNHREDKLPIGAPASIMYSQNEGPYNPCIYDLEGDNSCNKTARRPYYIDELFDPTTPVPEWGE